MIDNDHVWKIKFGSFGRSSLFLYPDTYNAITASKKSVCNGSGPGGYLKVPSTGSIRFVRNASRKLTSGRCRVVVSEYMFLIVLTLPSRGLNIQ